MQVFVHSPDTIAPLQHLGDVDGGHRLDEVMDLAVDELVWVEDGDEPLDVTTTLTVISVTEVIRLHRHRHRRIEVVIRYAGRSWQTRLAPSATVARMTREAAREFGIAPHDAADLVLRRPGTQEALDPEDHLGTLAGPRGETVVLDLVPGQRFAG